ncbi:glucocorticoid receptor-like (DNA-binding domain) [Gonapodya prolifera JEL478]|uniref:Glucocorticoid receptor-like (DNA-binding domain) n=1 Tax=Gonapodya prolifera (strain JEL478) TaxID=1344416 RepID=A0A139AYD8_GONPJ|nr:glucocorticoid receptor-like (DNA-binding domain) [Gonapodya prolifera JEL478]|eukprot:KXS21583.1 glucocorticoid receptor-like (DNA-binding domain) [Gonapodya prolifera JEL478]
MSDPSGHITVEYAKSGRAKCKFSGCKEGLIANKAIRFGRHVDSVQFEGTLTSWYHAECFAKTKKNRELKIKDVSGFTTLSTEDQETLVKLFDSKADAEHSGSNDDAADADGDEVESDPEYGIQYAASSRSSCHDCKDKIPTGQLRISIGANTSQKEGKSFVIVRWYHPLCFQKINAKSVQPITSIKQLTGWESIAEDHRKYVDDCLEGREPDGEVPLKAKEPKEKKESRPSKKRKTAAKNGKQEEEGEDGTASASDEEEDESEGKGSCDKRKRT